MARFKIYTLYLFAFFPLNKSTPTPVTHPCHLSLQSNSRDHPFYPPRSSRVWNLLHGDYCREMTRQEINPEARRRMGYPLSQCVIVQNIQIVGSRGLHFPQIPRSRHYGVRNTYMKVRSKVPDARSIMPPISQGGVNGRFGEWTTRVRSAGN